ncbi:MAG: MoxR-like ATPase [Armatimonadetes bacterium OLB18]|nr:MAG: MoxR-like ATPase [Armatimonadetes bacterium OLB18]
MVIEYPPNEVEVDILRRHHSGFRPENLDSANLQRVVAREELLAMQSRVREIGVEEKILDYIQQTVASTRRATDILVGASPRAGIAMLNCGKALAAIRGREFVIPDDIKDVALPILRHRVILRPEAEVEGLTANRVLQSLIEAQVVPR